MDWMKGFSLGAVVCINDSFMHMVRNMGIFKPEDIADGPVLRCEHQGRDIFIMIIEGAAHDPRILDHVGNRDSVYALFFQQ